MAPRMGKYGCFSEPSYIGIGDPYDKGKNAQNPRDTGLNFKASKCKTGKLNDGMFDKCKPLYEREPYEPPTKARVEMLTARKAKMTSEAPFKPGTPMKKSSGLGDFYGTLGGKVKYVESGDIMASRKKGDFPPRPPNIITSPAKKGGFGYNKTTLSEKDPERKAKGVAGEYEYVCDPFEQGGVANRLKAVEARRAKMVSDLPFKPSSPAKKGSYGYIKTNLGNKATGLMGEYKYAENGPTAPVRSGAKVETPFKPPTPARTGYNATITKFPEYKADPMEPKLAETKRQREEALAKMQAAPWNPADIGCHSGPVDSIFAKNV